MCPRISKRGKGGGFGEKVLRGLGVQGLIVDARRRRVGSDFCSHHDERELRKTRKGRNKGSTRGKLRCETKKLRKPYSREKPRNRGTKKMQKRIRNMEIKTDPGSYQCAESKVKSNQWRKIIPLIDEPKP